VSELVPAEPDAGAGVTGVGCPAGLDGVQAMAARKNAAAPIRAVNGDVIDDGGRD